MPSQLKQKGDKNLRIEALKKHDFKTPKILYALIFRHSDGWTFLTFTETVKDAFEYKKRVSLPRSGFEFKIIPYTLVPKIKDPTHA